MVMVAESGGAVTEGANREQGGKRGISSNMGHNKDSNLKAARINRGHARNEGTMVGLIKQIEYGSCGGDGEISERGTE